MILDLFAGPGGWSMGARALGLEELGLENDPDPVSTALAAGHDRLLADVSAFPPVGDWEGLVASPPCQGFSRAGKGEGRRVLDDLIAAVPKVAAGAEPGDVLADVDPRSRLVLEPMRWLRELRPPWVALEQVPPVLPIWRAIGDALSVAGWSVAVGTISAECYGVPQTRRRAVLVASQLRPVALPAATHSRYHTRDPERLDPGVLPWVSMAHALGWGMTGRPYVTVATGTSAGGGTDPQALGGSGARRIIREELEAGRWWNQGRRVRDQSGTPRDEMWPFKRPATTVAGRPLVPDPGENSNRFNMSTKSRNDGLRVEVWEAGVLQGFPPDYPWRGNRTAQFRQVGNAVPPPVALALIRAAGGESPS